MQRFNFKKFTDATKRGLSFTSLSYTAHYYISIGVASSNKDSRGSDGEQGEYQEIKHLSLPPQHAWLRLGFAVVSTVRRAGRGACSAQPMVVQREVAC